MISLHFDDLEEAKSKYEEFIEFDTRYAIESKMHIDGIRFFGKPQRLIG